jgi:hypothetical protein
VLPASVRFHPHVATDDGGGVRHRVVDCNCGLVVHERVDDRGDQLGALVLSGTPQDEGHVEEAARLVEVSMPMASALVVRSRTSRMTATTQLATASI